MVSKYPRSWAPYSDRRAGIRGAVISRVEIPSQLGTLFGQTGPDKVQNATFVEIPSQLGTLFGQMGVLEHNDGVFVEIPSQLGTLFGQEQLR